MKMLGQVVNLPHFARFIPPYHASMTATGFWTLPGLDESDSWLVATREKMALRHARRAIAHF